MGEKKPRQTFDARISLVLERLGLNSDRALARAAGLESETHVGLLRRAADAKVSTIDALARVGGVSFEWLATGRGHPDAVVVGAPPPALAAALAARSPGPSARAAAEALAREVEASTDVWDEFLEDVDRAEARVRKHAAKAATPREFEIPTPGAKAAPRAAPAPAPATTTSVTAESNRHVVSAAGELPRLRDETEAAIRAKQARAKRSKPTAPDGDGGA